MNHKMYEFEATIRKVPDVDDAYVEFPYNVKEWFPSSGYEAVEGPEILWNESPDTGNPKYRSEIWIPVKVLNL